MGSAGRGTSANGANYFLPFFAPFLAVFFAAVFFLVVFFFVGIDPSLGIVGTAMDKILKIRIVNRQEFARGFFSRRAHSQVNTGSEPQNWYANWQLKMSLRLLGEYVAEPSVQESPLLHWQLAPHGWP